jgi:hypothetical protein
MTTPDKPEDGIERIVREAFYQGWFTNGLHRAPGGMVYRTYPYTEWDRRCEIVQHLTGIDLRLLRAAIERERTLPEDLIIGTCAGGEFVRVRDLTRATMQYVDYICSEAWRERARLAKEAADYTCQLCGRDDGPVETHHKRSGYARLGCERLSDLVVLCADCHATHHRRFELTRAQQRMLPFKVTMPSGGDLN